MHDTNLLSSSRGGIRPGARGIGDGAAQSDQLPSTRHNEDTAEFAWCTHDGVAVCKQHYSVISLANAAATRLFVEKSLAQTLMCMRRHWGVDTEL